MAEGGNDILPFLPFSVFFCGRCLVPGDDSSRCRVSVIANSVQFETVSWAAVGVELVMCTLEYFETRRERLGDVELSGRRFSMFSVFWGLSSAGAGGPLLCMRF